MITYTGESFFFPHSGRHGVILLHAYTGNTNDVRMLGRQLNWQGYTVFAPLLHGHGGDPQKVLESNGPDDWWDDSPLYSLVLSSTHSYDNNYHCSVSYEIIKERSKDKRSF